MKYFYFLISFFVGTLFFGVTFAEVAPKKLHFIWLGSDIPPTYLDNIKLWAQLNRDYTIYLWSDRERTFISSIIRLDGVPFRYVVRDLKELEKIMIPIYPRLLAFLHREKIGIGANYAAASDIYRLFILLVEGGIYMDADNIPFVYAETQTVEESAPLLPILLGEVDVPCGMRWKQKKIGLRESETNNDFVVAPSGSEIVRQALILIQENYLASPNEDVWSTKRSRIEASDSSPRKNMTMHLTGPAFYKMQLAPLAASMCEEPVNSLARELEAMPIDKIRESVNFELVAPLSSRNIRKLAQHLLTRTPDWGNVLSRKTGVNWTDPDPNNRLACEAPF